MEVTSTYCDVDDCYNQVEELESHVSKDAGWHLFKKRYKGQGFHVMWDYHAVCFHCAEMYGEDHLKGMIANLESDGWEYIKPGHECYNPDCTNWCEPKDNKHMWGEQNRREADSTCTTKCHDEWMAKAS